MNEEKQECWECGWSGELGECGWQTDMFGADYAVCPKCGSAEVEDER